MFFLFSDLLVGPRESYIMRVAEGAVNGLHHNRGFRFPHDELADLSITPLPIPH